MDGSVWSIGSQCVVGLGRSNQDPSKLRTCVADLRSRLVLKGETMENVRREGVLNNFKGEALRHMFLFEGSDPGNI